MQISVSNPIKTQDRYGGGYVRYTVGSHQKGTGGSRTVHRRYNDFCWLSKELARKFPCIVVPPLPEKSMTNKFADEFIEARRRALERYLEKIMQHSLLGKSQLFNTFLEVDEETLHITRQKEEKDELAANKKASLTERATTWVTGKAEQKSTNADIRVEDMATSLKLLQKLLQHLCRKTEALLKQGRDEAQGYLDLSHSLTSFGLSELEGSSLGGVLLDFSKAAEKESTVITQHAQRRLLNFLEPLEEYSRQVDSIKTAIHTRQEYKVTYISLQAEHDSKQGAYRKLVGSSKSEAQLVMKEAAVQMSQERVERAKEAFEKVTATLFREYEAFQRRRPLAIEEILFDFIHLKMETNRKSDALWSELYPQLKEVMCKEKGEKDFSEPVISSEWEKRGEDEDAGLYSSFMHMPDLAPPSSASLSTNPNDPFAWQHNLDIIMGQPRRGSGGVRGETATPTRTQLSPATPLAPPAAPSYLPSASFSRHLSAASEGSEEGEGTPPTGDPHSDEGPLPLLSRASETDSISYYDSYPLRLSMMSNVPVPPVPFDAVPKPPSVPPPLPPSPPSSSSYPFAPWEQAIDSDKEDDEEEEAAHLQRVHHRHASINEGDEEVLFTLGGTQEEVERTSEATDDSSAFHDEVL